MSYAKELGAQAPVGFFDPLGKYELKSTFCIFNWYIVLQGLSKNVDKATFDYYRASEIKHGRVAMLAVLGYIVPEVYKFPGEIAPGIKFADIPNGVAALQAVPALGWIQIFFLIGFIDFRTSSGLSAAPFAFESGKIKFDSAEAEAKAISQEISHSRLAMLASLELLRHNAQDFISGTDVDGLGTKLITGLPFLYGN